MPVAPVFTNMAMFTTPISVAENTTAVGAAGFFIATGAVSYSLTGADMARFTITNAGTLTFNTAPNFEMPRGAALSGSNTNNYTIGITARSSAGLTTQSSTITIQVTDVNEAPLFPGFAPPTFTEYSTDTITLAATDVDAGQTLTYRVNAPTHGATITGNTFTWTPGEDDGGVLRTFSLTVTDSGTPSMSATRGINITAAELANRAPTGATITGATMVTSPNTLSLMASATDPDTGTTLTYDWNLDDGAVAPFNAASTTFTPPTLAAGDTALTIDITVTVSDGTLSTTATHTITVNPPVPTGTAPAFTNMASFATPISVAENTTAAGAPNFFAAPGTGTVTLTLGGADATRFSITAGGTLTFATAPNFEMPRGMALSGSNTNDYALTVTAMNDFGMAQSGAITVRVTDANDAPVLPSTITPPAFREYDTGTFTLSATDVDAGQTLTYSLVAPTHGATVTGTTFSWTPGEDDGGEMRTFTVRVTDSGTPPMSATRAFNITAMELPNRAPTGATLTVAGSATSVTNPGTLGMSATATDPDTGDTLTYTWSSSASGGSFSPATGASTTWTPPTVMAATTVTLTVTVSDNATPPLTTTAMQDVTVNPADTAPVFSVASFPAQTFTMGTAVDLTLPGATGGNGDIVYALAPAIPGLTLDPSTHVLSGTPNTAAAAANFTYTASDTDANEAASDRATLTISITVNVPATGFTVSVVRNPGGPISTVREGATLSVRVTATPTPAGSVFAADQEITITVTPPSPASRPDSAADPYVTYNPIAPRTVTLAVGAANAATSFSLQSTDDAFDHADFPLTITAMAAPSGVTGTATVTLLDNDISITTTTPTATVAAGATATYDVQLGEAPPTATTVTVASQGTGTATVSPATLTFTTTNWNTAQPVTVTGVAVGTTTIRHTAPASGNFTFVTNDVSVTVTAPAIAAPVFTNAAAFDTPIEVEENQSAVRGADYFAASDTSTGNLMLSGADMGFFTLSPTGTLTFNDPPNFERPRGMAFNAGSNTNDYALTVAATNSTDTTNESFTVRVTDANDAPVLAAIPTPGFTEYTAGGFTITATDVDAGQTLTYALTAGAAFGAAIDADSGAFTWTPREMDGEVEREFSVTVTDSATPAMMDSATFAITAAERPNQNPTVSIEDTGPVTNPNTLVVSATATDPDTGDMLTYTWSSDASGDSFSNGGVGASVTWMPPTVIDAGNIILTVTVSDGNGGSDTDMHTVTVNPDSLTPAFASGQTIPAQTYTQGAAIMPLTLPAVETDGNGATTYTLTPPAGLSFDPATRVLTGTPTAVAAAADYTYTAADGDTNTMPTDTATLTFSITVNAPDTSPAFAANAGFPDQYFIVHVTIRDPLTLPAVATPGNGATTYTLTPPIAGLTLNPTSRVLSGRPTVTASSQYTYTASDADDDTDTLTFNIAVEVDSQPAFPDDTSFPTQNYVVNAEIEPVTLPSATGGNGPLKYRLAPGISGLTLDQTTRVLTGTPTVVAGTSHSHTVTDSDGNNMISDANILEINVVVRAQATGFTLNLEDQATGTAVTEVREGRAPDIRVVATPTPSGSAFGVTQMVTLTATSPPTRPASAADPYVSYTATAPGPRTIAANIRSSPAFLFSLTTRDDGFDHADFPVVITVTAQPSGVTSTRTITLRDNDIGIRTTVAAVSVTEGETATYDVQLGERPPAGATVSVVSQATANATVSPATLTFSTTNWNMAQTVTVTGVLAGAAAIRHTAPASGGFTYVTTDDVAVTVIVPATAAPVFANMAAFATPIEVAENQSAVRGTDFFGASETTAGNLTLGGADAGFFTLSDTGTLIFNDAPDFEMPRGMAFDATSNTNNYAVTVTAMNAEGTTPSGPITVRVTDVNEAPVLAAIPTPGFTEYTAGGFTIAATDVDAGQTLTFALTGETHGATLDAGGGFTWTPREMDGDTERMFTAEVTDSGDPPQMASVTFAITAAERPNQAPTGVMITNTEATIQNPATLVVSATASDPDTGDTLTYTWSVPADSGTFSDGGVGASVTWTPPTVMDGATTTVTLTVTVSDDATPPLTTADTHNIMVSPVPDTSPSFGGATVSDQVYTVDMAITPLTLPAVETEGNGATIYALPGVPTGLTFDPSTRILTGTPTVVTPTTVATYTASDTDGNTDLTDRASLTVSFTVNAGPNVAPTGATISVAGGATMVTNPATLVVTASATDADMDTLTYTWSSSASGDTFAPATGASVTWTPPTIPVGGAASSITLTVTVTDGRDGSTTAMTMITVNPVPDTAPTFAVTSIAPQIYMVDMAITPLTLPAATGGNGAIVYTLPGVPAGLTFDTGTRVLTGTPTVVTPTTVATYTASDTDGNTDLTDRASLTVSFTVNAGANNAPTGATISVAGGATMVTNPATLVVTASATDADMDTLTYTWSSSASGDTFAPATGASVTWTPPTIPVGGAASSITLTVTVTDGRDGSTTAMTMITVNPAPAPDTAPAFASGATIPTQNYIQNVQIEPLTLPAATGGDGAIIYNLLGSNGSPIPDLSAVIPGLTLDTAARTITGTPTTAASSSGYIWAASDSDDDTSSSDRVRLGFNIVVRMNVTPAFASGATIPTQNYIQNVQIEPLTLPAATGGDGAIIYNLLGSNGSPIPDLSAVIPGLTLDTAARTITGTPTTAASSSGYIWAASDSDDDTSSSDRASTSGWASASRWGRTPPRPSPSRPSPTRPTSQHHAIARLTLPVATGGNGAITYALIPPAGLSFDPATRVLSGTPTAFVTDTMFTYTATDADADMSNSDRAMLTFTITVTRPRVTTSPITGPTNGMMSVTTREPTGAEGVAVTRTITVEDTAPATVQDNSMLVEIRDLTLPGTIATMQMVEIRLSELPGNPPVPVPGRFTIAAADATEAEVRANIVEITVLVDGVRQMMLTSAVTVCLPVSPEVRTAADDAGATLVLLHYDGSAWNVLPMSMLNEARTRICAATNSFSPFAVGFRLAVPEEAAKQWLAHFGRTVATQAVDAIGDRFRSAARPVSQVTIGGRTVSLAPSAGGGQGEAPISRPAPGLMGGPGLMGSPGSPWSTHGALDGGAGASHDGLWGSEDQAEPSSMSGRELLRGARFTLALGGGDRDNAMDDGAQGVWTAWGRSAVSGFDDKSDTGQSAGGKVFTGYMGADYAIGDALGGVAVSFSHGEGDFAGFGVDSGGELDASLASVYPYMRWTPFSTVEFWGLLGYGQGELELKSTDSLVQTAIRMSMAAFGGRWGVVSAGEIESALKADALVVRMASDDAPDLSATTSTTQRLRLALEVRMSQVALRDLKLTPVLELGVRWDGGDAQTGVGVELGGGVVYVDPRLGLNVEAKGRVLLAHQEEDFRQWGASVSGRLDPESDGRGLTLSLTPAWGEASSAVDTLWGSEAGGLPGAGSHRNPSAMPDRVDLELGYAMASGGLFTLGAQPGRSTLPGAVLTPYGSLSLSDGRTNRLREGLRWTVPGLDTRLELFGEHSLGAREQAEHRIGFTGSVRF